jgi:2-polyprenyl-3-methyl-5-hydroxy-6-metoxy-1,4-benzoquinol methylase
MSLFVPPRRFDSAIPEVMDRRGNDPELLRADLRVLESINRLLGGHRIALRYLEKFLGTAPMSSFTVLDLATGGGDIPRTVVAWAHRRKVRVEITAVDGNPEILKIAREWCAASLEIHVEQHDLLHLPYPTASFDFVLCSLTLHHFAEADVVAILRRIHDIARVGYIINDLRRNRIAICLGKLMAHTIITNPIARFDTPASCERAFAISELRSMATQAGMGNAMIRRHRVFRMALMGHK